MLLKSALGVAGTALLAACGGSSSGSTPTTAASSGGAATTAATSAATSAATTAAGGAASPAATTAATSAASPAATAAATTAAAATDKFKGQKLIVNGYGAEWQDVFNKVLKDPFEKKYGVTVILDTSGSAAEDYAKTRAAGGNPGWDLDSVTAQEPVQGAKENLLLKFTEDKVPNLKKVYPALRQIVGDYGAPQEIQYMSMMYSKEQFPTPPDSWEVFFDDKYKGHILLFDLANIMGVFFLFMLAKMNGGDMQNLDPGWKAAEKLKGRLIAMPTSSSDAVTYMQKGDVWLMPYWDGRAAIYSQQQGLPYDFVIPKEGSVALVNAMIIPKGAKNPDLAYEFANFWLEPETQKGWSTGYFVGPNQPDVQLPADFKQKHITSLDQLNKLLQPDYDYIAKNRPQWTEQWRRIFSS